MVGRMAKLKKLLKSGIDPNYESPLNGADAVGIAAEFTEHLPDSKRLHKGMIQLQLHDPGMIVQFKDIWLKVLK